MKKLVKVALGAVAFICNTELFFAETVANKWRKHISQTWIKAIEHERR